MKANYTKPLLAVEFFSPVQTTARDCADTLPKEQFTLNDPTACVWDLGGGTAVFVDNPKCTIDGSNLDIGCYNNPTEENYIFRS